MTDPQQTTGSNSESPEEKRNKVPVSPDSKLGRATRTILSKRDRTAITRLQLKLEARKTGRGP